MYLVEKYTELVVDVNWKGTFFKLKLAKFRSVLIKESEKKSIWSHTKNSMKNLSNAFIKIWKVIEYMIKVFIQMNRRQRLWGLVETDDFKKLI